MNNWNIFSFFYYQLHRLYMRLCGLFFKSPLRFLEADLLLYVDSKTLLIARQVSCTNLLYASGRYHHRNQFCIDLTTSNPEWTTCTRKRYRVEQMDAYRCLPSLAFLVPYCCLGTIQVAASNYTVVPAPKLQPVEQNERINTLCTQTVVKSFNNLIRLVSDSGVIRTDTCSTVIEGTY